MALNAALLEYNLNHLELFAGIYSNAQMCNTLIERATSMLAGGEIFRLIEQEQQREAVKLLETSLKVHVCFRPPSWSRNIACRIGPVCRYSPGDVSCSGIEWVAEPPIYSAIFNCAGSDILPALLPSYRHYSGTASVLQLVFARCTSSRRS